MMINESAYAKVPLLEADEPVPIVAASSTVEIGVAEKIDNEHNDIGTDITVWAKGEIQQPEFRDPYFAIAFVVQLIAVAVATTIYGINGMKWFPGGASRRLDEYPRSEDYDPDDHDENDGADEKDIISVFAVSIVATLILSTLVLSLLKDYAKWLIKFSLCFSIGTNVLLFCISVIYGRIFEGAFIFGVIALILSCYAKAVWHRIPYAASNLKSAVTALRTNLGVAILGFAAFLITIGWICLWVPAMLGTVIHFRTYETTDDNSVNFGTSTSTGTVLALLLLLSFYWTTQVIRNTIHTTIAGVIGTWWFLPVEASSCCSKSLTDSLTRATTYSFGSICFGSLIVAILEVIQQSLRSTRNNRNLIMLRCIVECLLMYIIRLVEYFNKWAFIYVGLYGYSYMEAGKNVMALFKSRGWATIISDCLVIRMLDVMCLWIGLVVALLAMFAGLATETIHGDNLLLAAIGGFLIGIILSNVMMGVVVSAVDSIIVLYAEAPAEFQVNHPALFVEMDATWTDAWPTLFRARSVNGVV